MKKIISIILISIMLFALSSCGQEPEAKVELDFSQVKNICNIATLECYYHNVAEGKKPRGTNVLSLLGKDQKCWIEYTGTAILGVDGELVQIEANGTEIIITMPKAKVLRLGYDESENFNVYTSKQLIPLNTITEDDKTACLKEGQEKMLAEAEENHGLLEAAQKRAKQIISDYIEQIGALTNTTYNIIWKDL